MQNLPSESSPCNTIAPSEGLAEHSRFFQRLHRRYEQDLPLLPPGAPTRALMEQTLAAREHKLLGQVPVLLEKRYEQLCAATGAGPVVFGREWEAIVLAELHLRLQPVVGMMEAWGASPQTTQ